MSLEKIPCCKNCQNSVIDQLGTYKCDTCLCHSKKKSKVCEYDSFWDCHSNKAHCKKHFRII